MAEPIAAPGVYDLPAADYHADPVAGGSLSATGTKKLLPPSCPALFAHWRENGEAPRDDWDFGHCAHKHVLGAGDEIAVVDARDWRTNKAKDARDAARAAGKIPILAEDHEVVLAMAKALADDPVAGLVFRPGAGKAEQTLIWQDTASGLWCRALLDWLPNLGETGRLIIPDYKTCASAEPGAIEKAIRSYGYHISAAHYLDGARTLGLGTGDAQFLLIFQEKTAPYLVTTVQISQSTMRVGAARMAQARAIYTRCTTEGRWPGYTDGIAYLGLPAWDERRELEELYG